MANRLKENFELRMKWYREGNYTSQDLRDYYNEATEALYQMFRTELISTKVYQDAMKVAYEYSWKILNMWKKEKDEVNA